MYTLKLDHEITLQQLPVSLCRDTFPSWPLSHSQKHLSEEEHHLGDLIFLFASTHSSHWLYFFSFFCFSFFYFFQVSRESPEIVWDPQRSAGASSDTCCLLDQLHPAAPRRRTLALSRLQCPRLPVLPIGRHRHPGAGFVSHLLLRVLDSTTRPLIFEEAHGLGGKGQRALSQRHRERQAQTQRSSQESWQEAQITDLSKNK